MLRCDSKTKIRLEKVFLKLWMKILDCESNNNNRNTNYNRNRNRYQKSLNRLNRSSRKNIITEVLQIPKSVLLLNILLNEKVVNTSLQIYKRTYTRLEIIDIQKNVF